MQRVAVLTMLGVLTLTGCASDGSPSSHPSAGRSGGAAAGSSVSPAPAGRECRADYTPSPLPTWARTGFQPPDQPMPYVLGDKGEIVAILWADHHPLVVPPAADRNNKILWVPRGSSGVGDASLRIEARLDGRGQTETRTVEGGPGPSIIDLPSPGCWSLDLTWGDYHDHLELEYASG
jgi:hypothetical protein